MQTQLTVRLPDDLRRALTAASREMQRKSSDVVRLALRQFLTLPPAGRGRPADRARHLVGAVASGVPDLAQRHRAYIVKSLKNAR
jgi:ribbon-helix-helix CopG family protein